jgi:protein gp37
VPHTEDGMSRVLTRNWCDAAHNEWTGCSARMSPGCMNCCVGRELTYVGSRKLQEITYPLTVFVGPAMDWLDEKVPESWRTALLDFVGSCSHHFLFLTKRPQLMRRTYIRENVSYGISVENQETLDLRYPILRDTTPRNFICAQPLLAPIDFSNVFVEFVAFGGESGFPHPRTMQLEHLRSSILSAEMGGIQVLVKQLGKQPGSPIMNVEPSLWPPDLRHYAHTL